MGIRTALARQSGTEDLVATLDEILAMEGSNPPRNHVGPVGVYPRNTLNIRNGYKSLKDWEEVSGNRCKLVITVGTYANIAQLAGYADYRDEDWVISAVSFTGAANLENALREHEIDDNILMTQVVPALDSELPIVQQARDALGDQFGYVSLEGYIVGKMFLAIVSNIDGELTRENFMNAVRNQRFDLDGLTIDFTDDNQGSDFVLLTELRDGIYRPVDVRELQRLFNTSADSSAANNP